MAIVPDNELRNPIFTELPEVSTHDAADVDPPESSTRLPHADRTSATDDATARAPGRRLLIRDVLKMMPFTGMGRNAGTRAWDTDPYPCRRTLGLPCFTKLRLLVTLACPEHGPASLFRHTPETPR
jgi:hypothetical protein